MDITFAPVVSGFMHSPARHKFITGSVGSGKTIGAMYLLLMIASKQRKAPDGIRYTRFAVCRQTLQQAKQTVLKDMQLFFKGFHHYKVSEATIYIRTGDIDCEIIFYPLDTPEDQRRLLSTQMTAVWFNEFVEIDPELIVAAYGRCGRFPPATMGGCTWHGVFGDSNPGTADSPWYDLLKVHLPPGWAYFEQPDPLNEDGTLSTNAENAHNLPENYYQELSHGATPEWEERYIHGRWGSSLAGQAVFKNTFVPKFHTAKGELQVSRRALMLIGLDTGRNPAAVFGQVDARGRLLILAEAYASNMGMKKFIRDHVKPMIYSERLSSMLIACVVDPAGLSRGDIGEESVIEVIQGEGFEAAAASTNSFNPRVRAVESWFMKQTGGDAMLLIDPINCPMLLKALRGGYKFPMQARKKELADRPDKNHPDSDLADALQYLCLGTGRSVAGRIMRRQNQKPEVAPPPGAWC